MIISLCDRVEYFIEDKGIIYLKHKKGSQMKTPKTIDEFKELSVSSYKEIKEGDVYYDGSTKIEVTSGVYINPEQHALWFDSIKTYEDGFSLKSHESLSDKNITNGGYNPWMLFRDKKTAILHKKQNWVISIEKGYRNEERTNFETPSKCENITLEFMLSNFPMREVKYY